MKILMTWEMDSNNIHLHHLRLIAHGLRQRYENLHIILASTQPIQAADASWANEVFLTSRVQFKHEHGATGLLANLCQLGWVAPDLRPWAFTSWSQLFRETQPDLVIAEASPGALLSAVLEDIPVIQSSNGLYMTGKEDMIESDVFPEFQQWLWHLTGKSYGQLMNKPGLSFCPSTVDSEKPGLVFNVSPARWPWEEELPVFDEDVIILASPGELNETARQLAELGLTSRRIDQHRQPFTPSKNQILIGRYDRYSISVAAQFGSLYLGCKPLEKESGWAARCDAKKLSYRAESPDVMSMILSSIQLNKVRVQPVAGSYVEIGVALGYMMPR